MSIQADETAVQELSAKDAETYAAWFSCLAEPMRVRLLHAIATYPGAISVGGLAEAVDIRQPTVSHHLRKLAESGFVTLTKVGTSTRVTVNPDCCTGLPHATDVVMGLLGSRPCCPTDLPGELSVRPMLAQDMDEIRQIYSEGVDTGRATLEPRLPGFEEWSRSWLEEHRWVAELDAVILGWAAAQQVSTSEAYSGVAEAMVYVAGNARGRGVGKSLVYRQVNEADRRGLWSLQASILPENKVALALHHSAGYRTVGVRERIARLNGKWHDLVLLERRRPDEELASLSGPGE